MSTQVFVFGSNEGGRHGAGAALFAYKKHGARYGFSYGHTGDSFAIPTMDQAIQQLHLVQIKGYVEGFISYAYGHPELQFQVTQIGCGLGGRKPEDIAPMFKDAPLKNCFFDDAWLPYIGTSGRKYWGTF